MSENVKNISIGIVTSLAVIAVVVILLFLHPSFGDGEQRLCVRFANIEKIYKGSRVSYAGSAIGTVVSITQLPEEKRVVKDGNLYVYELTLAVDSKSKVYDTDEITISTSGLMGERFISIIPGRSAKQNNLALLDETSVVYATQPLSTEAVFEKVYAATSQAEQMLRSLADVIDATAPHVKETVKNLNSTSSDLKNVMATITAAESTLGKMAMNDDLYVRTATVLNKLDTVLGDVNSYGFLFHMDKSWMRERKRQIEEISAIKDAQDLQAYLKTELAKINASAVRIDLASKKAKQLDSSEQYYEACGEASECLSTVSKSLENSTSEAKKLIAEK